MIRVIEGGINRPRVPAPAKVPIIIRSGYFRALSSGIDIFPTVATVAAEEPDIAAKTVHPAIFTCSNPPGSPPQQGRQPLEQVFGHFCPKQDFSHPNEQRQGGQRPTRRSTPDRSCHRITDRSIRKQQHANRRDTDQAYCDPHAGPEQEEQDEREIPVSDRILP